MLYQLLAQINNPAIPGGNSLANPGDSGGGTAIGQLIGNIIGAIVIIAFLMAIFYLMFGGISWLTGGSDKAQLESARNKITHAIVGLIIVASIWAIMNIVGPFLGLDFPNLRLPTMY